MDGLNGLQVQMIGVLILVACIFMPSGPGVDALCIGGFLVCMIVGLIKTYHER